MGLTSKSVGLRALTADISADSHTEAIYTVALAGNPNVGKSTVFNALTGMKQHTGNWPGKTVSVAQGICHSPSHTYRLIDLPGTYSLLAHSAEEEVARNFICFGEPDAVVVVCDATSPVRNLQLVLQALECTSHVLVCMNLMDEAERKQIRPNLDLLSRRLGVPVIGCTARKKKTLDAFLHALDHSVNRHDRGAVFRIPYPESIETAIVPLERILEKHDTQKANARWLALKILENDPSLMHEICDYLGENPMENPEIAAAYKEAREMLARSGIDDEALRDLIASAAVHAADELCRGVIDEQTSGYGKADRRLDRLLTGKWTAYPIMLLFLALILFLTVTLSNYPSRLLSAIGSRILAWLSETLISVGAPPWLRGVLVDGILGVLFWVVSVMLPPMAIFFPLFTLLEDAGFLPRIAYNLDRPFARCDACGKQALTMCMGFGCNAAGVVGCRIIDSPRERTLAILTNALVPCNGRFPALISIIAMFFVGFSGSLGASLLSAALLCLCILISILATLAVTRLLASTLLRGQPSSFTLELPPFRPPEVGRVLVRSLLDRTLYVLGRAVMVAAPAGLVIWVLANVTIADTGLLLHCAAFLDPFAALMGLDGIILMAFILGFPANEIVIPIIIMAYLAEGRLTEFESLTQMKSLFVENGWTWQTAVCVLIFFLFHWPCSTTLLTVKKETGSIFHTLLAALIPTALGILLCMLFTAATQMFV